MLPSLLGALMGAHSICCGGHGAPELEMPSARIRLQSA